MRGQLIAVAFAALLAMPAAAWAGDRPVAPDGAMPPVNLLPPADSGKPLFPPAPLRARAAEPEGCVSPLPCGTRLLGAARKNGAVEVQLPALRW